MPDLSVADNISISNPPRRFGLIDQRRTAPHRRGGAGARRRRRHPSVGAREGPVLVAPADGRDRQGAGARSRDPDPRRGHLGADRGRRDARSRRAQAAAQRGPRARLHLAPHARDRRAGRRLHGVSQRPQRGELRGRHAKPMPRSWRLMIGREIERTSSRQGTGDGRQRDAPPRAHGRRACAGTSRLHDISLSAARRRGGGPRRPRRPGPARVLARAVRRAARRDAARSGSTAGRCDRRARARPSAPARALRWCPRTARPTA